jgi:phosphate transport system protein
MAREAFQRELDDLIGDILELGHEVEDAVDAMVEAMETGEAARVEKILGTDIRYKEWGGEIGEECLLLQVRQAPVAGDLRLIYVAHDISNHLVRAGTLTEHICQAVVETADAERDDDLQAAILEMARSARDVFRNGLEIFEARDMERARDLEALDDKVDLLYSEAMSLVTNPSDGTGGSPEWRARAALTVHYLERIADHGVDIGAATVFLVSGERMESALHQYRDRRLDHEDG